MLSESTLWAESFTTSDIAWFVWISSTTDGNLSFVDFVSICKEILFVWTNGNTYIKYQQLTQDIKQADHYQET